MLKRKTKIVATVGPSCEKPKRIKELLRAGVDIFRINSSHTSPETLRKWIRSLRKNCLGEKKQIGILVDLQGPRVRTGSLKDKRGLLLLSGQEVTVTVQSKPGDDTTISTSCKELPIMVKKGDPILLDNGIIALEVIRVSKKSVKCRVTFGGVLGENKGINLPNAPTTLPALTAKDKKALEIVVKEHVDFIALSFVRDVSDIRSIKSWLRRHKREIPVIAKIEKPQALENISEIFKNVEGIMVARGDLGIEMGIEKVPVIQKEIIEQANEVGIPVITATQMLESMMEQAQPTRAEISDIANAVFDGTDAVMLSGETAVGKYPVKAVQTMAKSIIEAEKHIEREPYNFPSNFITHNRTRAHVIAHAGHEAALELNAKAILVFTRSGKTALYLSKMKPLAPVIAFSDSQSITRQLALLRGVHALTMKFPRNTDRTVSQADRIMRTQKLLTKGAPVILISGKQAIPGSRFMAKIHVIGER